MTKTDIIYSYILFQIFSSTEENKITQVESIPLDDEKAHLTVPSAISTPASERRGTDSPLMMPISEAEAVSL